MIEIPYLLEYLFCCQFTTDNKIIDLLEDLATLRSKCPINTKIETYGDNYRKLYVDVLKHYKLKDGGNVKESNVITNWSSIRKKALKDFIIKNFIIRVQSAYKFEEKTVRSLKRDLAIGLNYKTVNDKNILMKDGEIAGIVGLNLGVNSYRWEYEILVLGPATRL